jgi:hypothetical protein
MRGFLFSQHQPSKLPQSQEKIVAYSTRVLSKDEEFPSFEELAQLMQAEHPEYKLAIEEGGEEEWETLLLSSVDEVEVALIERHPVTEDSLGKDEIEEFLEDTRECKPESGVEWLQDYLTTVRTIYVFQPLQGAETIEGGNALHALRSALWARGDAIIQADGEGFTNEDGYHIVWQFSDEISGPWDMAVLQDGTWHPFKMDLGDPYHREAFLKGEIPDDLSEIRAPNRRG